MSQFSSVRHILGSAAQPFALFRRFSQDERGATAIEYGMICVFLGLAIVTGMQTFGSVLMEALPKTVQFPKWE
ncbi:Flp family type IVb pilin [Methylorubrum aminovorans]